MAPVPLEASVVVISPFLAVKWLLGHLQYYKNKTLQRQSDTPPPTGAHREPTAAGEENTDLHFHPIMSQMEELELLSSPTWSRRSVDV